MAGWRVSVSAAYLPKKTPSPAAMKATPIPSACIPTFKNRDLARALILTGLHLLRERGLAYATLGTSSENVAMQAAAQSAGFQLESSKVWFSKAV